jgi:hypothetical protein
MKTMLIIFFSVKDIVHFKFIPQDQTVNTGNTEAVCRKRCELWHSAWILHHDNAEAHRACSVKQFLAQKSITEMKHPPCSLDVAPYDFLLFTEIKSALKG